MTSRPSMLTQETAAAASYSPDDGSRLAGAICGGKRRLWRITMQEPARNPAIASLPHASRGVAALTVCLAKFHADRRSHRRAGEVPSRARPDGGGPQEVRDEGAREFPDRPWAIATDRTPALLRRPPP